MATIFSEYSRTFSEFLLIPNLTRKDCIPDNISLKTPLVRYRRGEQSPMYLNIPLTSAIMQSVSNHTVAIALARCGGLSFIYQSQPIESQVEMVRKVKNFKAGFVVSDSNLKPENTLYDVKELLGRTGHSTVAVTEGGTANGKLLGVLTGRDYRLKDMDMNTRVKDIMTPFKSLVYAEEGISLHEANDLIWEHKLNSLPVVDKSGALRYLVFRQDYDEHRENPDELIDSDKRLMVGAGVNTKDYRERIPVLLEAGADVLCIDSSDGFSEWQRDVLAWVRKQYGEEIKIGAGNVVDGEGFRYLAECGADFVKVGVGGGSICITREQKGIGRGQASAVIDVARAREEYFRSSGEYVPICSDGGIVLDYHILLALAMGADFVMMGRYFSRFDESPGRILRIQGNYVKEYWAEGSERARNWQRYFVGDEEALNFEEGVDIYVPYAGKLKDNVNLTLSKLKSTMCNCGIKTIGELQREARLTVVSYTTIREGGVHDVITKEKEPPPGT
jgi:IMP dehydrogenase